MTEPLRYAAFTTDPAGGNPAGVVLEADNLSDAEMQDIAKNIGYSETAFVLSDGLRDGERNRRLRYFSPLAEVDFCGHATIATAVALAGKLGLGKMEFATDAGTIVVDVSDGPSGSIVAELTSVPTHSRVATDDEVRQTLAALRWSEADLDDRATHVSFAGNYHLVLPVRTRVRLADLNYDFAELKRLMDRARWTTVNLVYFESSNLVHSRNPFPVGGVVEDPATGAAAAALGGYLLATGKVGGEHRVEIVQGADMGRPSLLLLTVTEGNPRVRVAGSAVPLDSNDEVLRSAADDDGDQFRQGPRPTRSRTI